jgi:hypothetical protein
MISYAFWFTAVLLAWAGTYFALTRTRFPVTWTEKHPWSTGVAFWGVAVICVVAGVDVR